MIAVARPGSDEYAPSFADSVGRIADDEGGIASDQPITVRALAYIVAGHVRHHLEVLEARYG